MTDSFIQTGLPVKARWLPCQSRGLNKSFKKNFFYINESEDFLLIYLVKKSASEVQFWANALTFPPASAITLI